MTAVIQVRGLVKRFGSVLAVHELSFEVQSATVTGFLGPNGAGNTTTQRTLLGQPEVLVLVEPANGLDPEGIHWMRGFLRPTPTRGAQSISSHVLSEVAQTVDHSGHRRRWPPGGVVDVGRAR